MGKGNRRARLRALATPEGMRVAAAVQAQRRGGLDHRFVVGQFFLVGGRVVLHAVRMGAAFDIPRPLQFTDDAAFFYRWRTRQAAHQFAVRWSIAEFHVVDLAFLDVLPA